MSDHHSQISQMRHADSAFRSLQTRRDNLLILQNKSDSVTIIFVTSVDAREKKRLGILGEQRKKFLGWHFINLMIFLADQTSVTRDVRTPREAEALTWAYFPSCHRHPRGNFVGDNIASCVRAVARTGDVGVIHEGRYQCPQNLAASLSFVFQLLKAAA